MKAIVLLMDKIYPFEALSDAFEYQQSGGHFGKICVTW